MLFENLLDYDILPADVLDFIDDCGCLNGEYYPCLIVPYYDGMPESILQKLLRAKLPVVIAVKPDMTVAEELRSLLGLERVVLIPSYYGLQQQEVSEKEVCKNLALGAGEKLAEGDVFKHGHCPLSAG